jgi:protein-L-isoaspartate O-methyltransferase
VTSLVQQTFGEAAADYAASAMHARGPSLARLIELANPKPSWRVLNIATGASHTALAFAPLVARVTAGRQQ